MSKKSREDKFLENIAIIVTVSLVLVTMTICLVTFFGNILIYKAGV